MAQFAEDFPVGSKVTRNNVEYGAAFIEDGVTYIVLGKGTNGTYLGGECIDLAYLDGTKVSPYPDGFACKAFDLVDGEYQLKCFHTSISDAHFSALGYRGIKQTRHIRRDLCGKTYSQDGQAVLDVVKKSYAPETIDVHPFNWIKPNAYNPIVNWVAEKFISAYAVVRKVAVAFIKHIK